MLPSVLEAILLGLVQGLSEFIPISSSGHLVLVEELFDLTERSLAFDVALHMGTMAAVIVYFHAELRLMIRGVVGAERGPAGLLYRRLGIYTVLASIPVAIVGGLYEGFFQRVFGRPAVAAGFLFVTAGLLFAGERLRDRRIARSGSLVSVGARSSAPTAGSLPTGSDPSDPKGMSLEDLSLSQALAVGVGQCLALFPGLSRSGTTIVMGMATGMTREAATRFSFLLSLPALAGAAIISLPDLGAGGLKVSVTELTAGVVTAFVSGYLAIRYLIALVSRGRLTGFAWYCLAVGTITLIALSV